MSRFKFDEATLARWTRLLAAARRQSRLEKMLGQVKCWGSHGTGSRTEKGATCPDCKACR